ncbi:type II toxin-antitoxin system HicB family antitoxin [Devosia aurantiaca]|uniref:type II toxin-antitoxin system HicB family antitoxin n=1 Tax=Devosia aurantiaca TaxID=2714858 RepID=UPI001A98E415|nr:type II toxin-antitoxin system HicB family antitoxin [Devosia aurantiaca]
MRYVAFIHKDSDSSYGISFPDVPGCISVGDTMDAVIANGAEALAFHISSMEADGEPVPAPGRSR